MSREAAAEEPEGDGGQGAGGFGRLVVSSGASNLADGVAKMALPLLAVGVTRSPALVAGLQLVRTLPWLVGALPVGALVDRLDRRRTLLAANLARAGVVAPIGAVLMAGIESIWLLYGLAVASGVAEVFADTAAQSLLPAVVPRDELDRANGRLFAVELGAQEFVGPPLAGVLVAAVGGAVLGVSSSLWLLAVVVLAGLRGRYRPAPPTMVEGGNGSGVTSLRVEIGEGLRFLRQRPVLRTMAGMVGVFNLASSAAFSVLVVHAVGSGSALGLTRPEFGLLLSILTAGSLLGGVTAEAVQRRLGRSPVLSLMVVGGTANLATLALTDRVVVIGAVFFLSGITTMWWNVVTVAFRQGVTPDRLLGRVNSVYRLLAWGTMPLGAALGGAIGEGAGTRAVFAVMAVVTMVLMVPARTLTADRLAEVEATPDWSNRVGGSGPEAEGRG